MRIERLAVGRLIRRNPPSMLVVGKALCLGSCDMRAQSLSVAALRVRESAKEVIANIAVIDVQK